METRAATEPTTPVARHLSMVEPSTRCDFVCVDDGGAEDGPDGRRTVRASRSSLLIDQGEIGRRSFCSWHDAGWRSLVVRELIAAPEADDVVAPAIDDQLVVLVLSGERTFESRHGRYWRRAGFVPGNIAMTAPGHSCTVRWRTESPEPQRALQVYLPGPLMAQSAAQLWNGESRAVRMPDTLSTADPVAEQVLRALADAVHRGVDDLYAESAAHFLAVHLISRHSAIGPPALCHREDRRVGLALDFMHDNLGARIGIADIAAAVNLSPYHFIHVFRAATGDPPRRYLNRLRVDRARSLLVGTRLGLPEVADRCGFSSVAHFRAAFVRETGETPARFRRAAGGG